MGEYIPQGAHLITYSKSIFEGILMGYRERYSPEVETEKRLGFSEQILAEWKRLYSETFQETVEQREREKERIEKREDSVDHKEILRVLEEFGIDIRKIDISTLENGRFSVKVSNHFGDRRLPDGYAYEGSAARALLMRNIDIDTSAIPRDIDVVRLPGSEPAPGMDAKVAMDFAPEDFEHGHGVEILTDYDSYFATRDLTINEVMATDQEVIATKQCILDTVRRIIRLTDYERWDVEGALSGPKMLAKILRLYSESIHRYGEAEIADMGGGKFEEYFISPFWLALQLDKACEVSTGAAKSFVQRLREHGQIPQDITGIEDAAEYLGGLLRDRPFYFRHAPKGQFEIENRWAEEYEDHEDGVKNSKRKGKRP